MVDQPSVFSEQEQPTQAPEQSPVTEQPESQPPQEQQPSASSDNLWADQLASIKNERGEPKYKDLPTALEALKHSQDYIPQVKKENETLAEQVERLTQELQRRTDLEETVERLTAKPEQPAPQESKGLTEEQITGLLEQRLAQRELEQKAQANSQQVEQAIVQRYGDKAQATVAAKAQEYDMSLAEMQQWAQKNPKAVLALFDVKPSPQGKSYTGSSVNIPPNHPQPDQSLAPPARSLLSGATTKELNDYMAQVRADTHKRLGVES